MGAQAVVVVPINPTFNVSTLTPLLSTLDIRNYRSILVSLQNPDSVNPVSLIIDPGTASGKFDTNRRQIAVASPGEEAHIEITEPNYPNIRILAQTDSPFPVVSGVTFEVRVTCATLGIQDWVLRTIAGSYIP